MTPKGVRANPKMYGDIFTAAITLEELDTYIGKKKKTTASGVSGIRIDHIAAAPAEIREKIAKLISLTYLTGIGYTHQKEMYS